MCGECGECGESGECGECGECGVGGERGVGSVFGECGVGGEGGEGECGEGGEGGVGGVCGGECGVGGEGGEGEGGEGGEGGGEGCTSQPLQNNFWHGVCLGGIDMYNHELEKLRDKIQSVKLELDRLQRQHHDLTGIAFVISGPRPRIETRQCIYINHYPADQRDLYPESEIEFEGQGVGAAAIADRLNLDPIRDELCVEFETAQSIAASDRLADEADYVYEKLKDRRMFPPLHEGNFGRRHKGE